MPPQPTKSQATRTSRRSDRKQAAQAARQRQKRQRFLLLGAAGAIAIVVLLIFLNRPGSEDVPEIDFASLPQQGATLGDTTAPVTVVVYADYQCPFCGQFSREVEPKLIQDFVETGQVSLEFRVLPFLGDAEVTSPDNESVQAAEAAACAMDQGKFWEYNHLLFENQDGENAGAFSDDKLKAFAGTLGLDQAAFDTCLDSGQHQQEILDNLSTYQAAGIASTPTIVIDGQTVQYTTDGYDLLKRQIEAAIAGEPIPQ
jgi:protein-disulfide isomerase